MYSKVGFYIVLPKKKSSERMNLFMKKKAILKLLLVMLFIASVMVLASCSKNFVVAFDSDGGSAVSSVEVKSGSKLASVPTPTKEGYTFDGWYLNADKWNFEHYAVTKDMTLKAKWIKNHTVVFDSAGGSAVSGAVVLDGTKITEPSKPIKEGAEFIGWYNGDALWDFAANTVSSDITLTARWREIFIVKFDTDGGNERIPEQTVKNGDLATAPLTPTKFGCVFAGWYSGETLWDFNTPITSDVSLKAKWTSTYTVTFDTDGAGKMDPLKLTSGSLIPAPAEISKDGYIFLGWYSGETLWDFANATVTTDVKLKAKWALITYGIVIDKDNGEELINLDLVPNSKIPAQQAPSRQGYRFAGWFAFDAASNSFVGDEWDFDSDVATTALVLKAKWIKVWTVKFEVGGNLFDEYTVDDGGRVGLPYADPEIPGTVFNGWFFGATLWDFANNTITSDVTLTASFLTRHTVSFNLAGGTSSVELPELILTFGDKIPAPGANPTKYSYVFDGWYDQNGNLWDFANNTVQTDVTLTARWATPLTVTFVDSLTNTVITSQPVLSGHTATPVIPTKYGYIFAHWYTADGNWDFENNKIYENTILYAQWTPNYWIISFDTDGAGSLSPVFVEKGDSIESKNLPIPQKEGVGFLGWLYVNNGEAVGDTLAPTADVALKANWSNEYFEVRFFNGAELVATKNVAWGNPYLTEIDTTELTPPTGGTYKLFGWTLNGVNWDFANQVTGNMDLVADWRKANTVTLELDAGGEVYKTLTAYTGKPAELVNFAPPTRDGYRFAGWYNGNVLWNLATDLVQENITLTAKWNKVYTVKYDPSVYDATIYVQEETVLEGDKFTKPKDPTRTNYIFVGWEIDGTTQLWDFNTPATGDLFLHAKWITTYYVSFDLNGGNGSIPRQEIIGNGEGYATKPADPTKDYMTFVGWYDGETLWDFNTPITFDVNLKAKWEHITYSVTFDANGGEGGYTAKFNAGEKLIAPAVTNANFILKEWQLPDGSAWDFNAPLTGDLTLKAIWTNEKVTVSFDLDGGSWGGFGAIPSQTVEYGALLEKFDAPYKTDYFFKGWFREDGSEWNFDTDVATENITLTAKWETDYTVVFKTDDGVYETQRTPAGELITPPLIEPTKYGYKFLGWYLDENTKWEFTEMTVTDDMILVAKWELQIFTITFVTLDPETKELVKLSEQTIKYGERAQLPEQPFIGPNYQFDSWRNPADGKIWNFNTDIVTEDMTLQAYWVTPGTGSNGGSTGPWDENTNTTQGPVHLFP